MARSHKCARMRSTGTHLTFQTSCSLAVFPGKLLILHWHIWEGSGLPGWHISNRCSWSTLCSSFAAASASRMHIQAVGQPNSILKEELKQGSATSDQTVTESHIHFQQSPGTGFQEAHKPARKTPLFALFPMQQAFRGVSWSLHSAWWAIAVDSLVFCELACL